MYKHLLHNNLLQDEMFLLDFRVKVGDKTYTNKNIRDVKFNQSIQKSDRFSIGGLFATSVEIQFKNYTREITKEDFERKEFILDMKNKKLKSLTVRKVHEMLVKDVHKLKVKDIVSGWVPIRKIFIR